MERSINNENYIECSACNGTGVNNSKQCDQCKGIGAGIVIGNEIIFWKGDISAYYAWKSRMKASVKTFFAIFYYGVGLCLLGSTMWFYYSDVINSKFFLDNTYFLTEFHYSVFLTYVCLLYVTFLYYRSVSSSMEKGLIKQGEDLSFKEVQKGSIEISQSRNFHQYNKVDVSMFFTNDVQKSLFDAWYLAHNLKHPYVEPVHLFAALPSFNKIRIIFSRLGLNGEKIQKSLAKGLSYNQPSEGAQTSPSIALRNLILKSYQNAREHKDYKVDVAHILHTIAEWAYQDTNDNIVREIMEELEISLDKIDNVISWLRVKDQLSDQYKKYRAQAQFKPTGNMNRAMTAIATPILDSFSQDLTRAAAYDRLFPCLGRDEEMMRIFRVIEGSSRSVLLIGPPGVGKKTLVGGIARKMVAESVPQLLQDKRLVRLSIPTLIGGVNPAAAQDRLLQLMNEVIRSQNIVLTIDNIQEMLGISVGGKSSLDLSQVLAEQIQNRRIFVIATTTQEQYISNIKGSAFEQIFEPIFLEEMDINSVIQVLELHAGRIEYKNSVYFSYDSIEAAATMSDRYMHDSYLPQKALVVLEEVAVYVKNDARERKIVTKDDVAYIVSKKTNIPLTSLDATESEKLLELDSLIFKRIIGQDIAVQAVVESLKRGRTQLRDQDKPIASFLFVGPTGVGKTELAKAISDTYFGSEDRMIRFDMSEYQEQASLGRLIGTADVAGLLTEKVRQNPFSLILFDELEKAHPDILNIFLQILDDGRLTDGRGRVVDFTNAIIICTSNAGTPYIQKSVKEEVDIQVIKEQLTHTILQEYYRPEFLNRFDDIIVFKPLTIENVVDIARILVEQVAKRLEQKNIRFTITESALQELAQEGYDIEFGARPLRRTIQKNIDSALANLLLSGKISKRDTVVYDVGGSIRVDKSTNL